MEKNKKNIFWFIIDSVRTFRSGLDDRDRLDVMDEFAEDSIEFTNCFTSAPSSLLAAGSLFTGLPAVFVARHFNDWKFIDPGISTIRTLVDKHGYLSIPLIDGRNAREKYQELLPPFPSSFLPKNVHLSDYVWGNRELTYIFGHILRNQPKEPFVFVFWYDCRRDSKISDHVRKALNLIKQAGYYNNSVILITSDHGYPDPRTSLDESFFKNLGHDMILTDDNIKTPLFLKYPGGPEGEKIDNVVGHTDIMPTLYDILNIPLLEKYDKMDLKGRSLLNIMEKNEPDTRIIRSDTRLRMDSRRITSYRSSQYKFVKFYDENETVLFDLKKDPKELEDISKTNTTEIENINYKFEELDKYYDRKLMENHMDTLETNFSKYAENLKLSTNKNSILIISPAPEELLSILISLLKQKFNVGKIFLISIGPFEISNLKLDYLSKSNAVDQHVIDQLPLKNYDLLIYLTHNSRRVYLKDEIIKNVEKIKADKKTLMNYNFEIFDYFSFRSFFSYLKLFFQFERKAFFYKQEPIYFIKDIWFYLKYSILYYFKKRNERMDGDIMTAREILAFRNAHLKLSQQGLVKMEEKEMQYETNRIRRWGKE